MNYTKDSLSRVRLFATPWTAAHQAPPSMGYSRQEYWSGLPLPAPLCTRHLAKLSVHIVSHLLLLCMPDVSISIFSTAEIEICDLSALPMKEQSQDLN